MNYIAEINAFEQFVESNYLSSMAQLLWYKLMQKCNRSGWQEQIQISNLRLMADLHIGSEKTLIKARKELEEAGLIEVIKGKKGCPNQYKLIPIKNTVNNTVQSEAENPVENTVINTVQIENPVENPSRNTVKNTAIYKQNKNNKKKDTNVSKEKSAASNRFIPPTLQEVQAYCQERENKVDAEQFVNFYSAKGWYVGKNKMKDWKACVRTWERNHLTKTNRVISFNNFQQRNTDYNALVRDYYEKALLG
ncbi:hypothetical protein NDGK_02539 [Clostridiales bacterium CHKCI001]|nr:hypothetical protein NDGK_02539 [Clostridiales bacterium CHKCI001]